MITLQRDDSRVLKKDKITRFLKVNAQTKGRSGAHNQKATFLKFSQAKGNVKAVVVNMHWKLHF